MYFWEIGLQSPTNCPGLELVKPRFDGPSGGCNIPLLYNTDFFLNDLYGVDTVDEVACCIVCQNNAQCAGFTFVSSSVGWRQCYVKSTVSQVNSRNGMISGRK
jgi:hypothetical protein